jgi:hypothetical protein
MADIIDGLKKKGWADTDIEKTSRILSEAHEKKSPTILLLDKVVYWTGLFLAIIGNFVISVILIPFLILMKSFYLYIALIFLGIVFGWVFSIIIKDIEAIKAGQHIVAWIFIPAVAIINVYVMTNLSNHIAKLMEIESGIHAASMVSVVYVLSFMFPYALAKAIPSKAKKQSL